MANFTSPATVPLPPPPPDVAPSPFHLTHPAQRHTAWLANTSARIKKCKIGSTHGSCRKMRNLFTVGFACCPRDGPKW
nr:expressed protein [Hymenolepis microstoma]